MKRELSPESCPLISTQVLWQYTLPLAIMRKGEKETERQRERGRGREREDWEERDTHWPMDDSAVPPQGA